MGYLTTRLIINRPVINGERDFMGFFGAGNIFHIKIRWRESNLLYAKDIRTSCHCLAASGQELTC